MKKYANIKISFLITIILAIALVMAGCGNTKNASEKNSGGNNTNEENVKFPDSVSISPDSTVALSDANPGSDGIPVLSVDKNNIAKEISFKLSKFDEGKDAYIFIDKKFIDKVQVGNQEDYSVLLKNDALKAGNKTLQVVQYQDDDKSKAAVKYNEEKFTIKLQ